VKLFAALCCMLESTTAAQISRCLCCSPHQG